jgi:hypothetical protein
VITSVTAATVAATSAVAGWGTILGAGGAVLVLVLLVALKVLRATGRPQDALVERLLRVSAIPLLTVFAVSIVARALTILGQS